MKRPRVFGLGMGVALSVLSLSGLLDLAEARTLHLGFDLRGTQRPALPILLVTAEAVGPLAVEGVIQRERHPGTASEEDPSHA